jgi:hypothetical protein
METGGGSSCRNPVWGEPRSLEGGKQNEAALWKHEKVLVNVKKNRGRKSELTLLTKESIEMEENQ